MSTLGFTLFKTHLNDLEKWSSIKSSKNLQNHTKMIVKPLCSDDKHNDRIESWQKSFNVDMQSNAFLTMKICVLSYQMCDEELGNIEQETGLEVIVSGYLKFSASRQVQKQNKKLGFVQDVLFIKSPDVMKRLHIIFLRPHLKNVV